MEKLLNNVLMNLMEQQILLIIMLAITDKIENKLIPSGKDTFNYVVLEPFGVSLTNCTLELSYFYFFRHGGSKFNCWKYNCN